MTRKCKERLRFMLQEWGSINDTNKINYYSTLSYIVAVSNRHARKDYLYQSRRIFLRLKREEFKKLKTEKQ